MCRANRLSRIRVIAALAVAVVTLAQSPAHGAGRLPVRVSTNGRYLEDQNGTPFFLHGDTAWSLIAALTKADAERYLEDRRRRGFTALIVSLIEHKYVPDAPKNRYGEGPFLTPGDFSTPNEAYFRHADWVIRRAGEKGMLVLLFPCYLGWEGGDQGFWLELNSNGARKAREYGRYLGRRYRDFTNIIWANGGDYSPPEEAAGTGYALEILLGIREIDPSKLHTYHGRRTTTSLDHARFGPYLSLDAVYTGDELGQGSPSEPYQISLRAYNRKEFRPHFLIEARYESYGSSKDDGQARTIERHRLRRQAYWSILSGAAGHFFGNRPVWTFEPGWDSPVGIDSPGNKDMGFLRQFIAATAWHSLIPDQDHSTVTAGFGTYGQTDYVTAGRAADGSLAAAYVGPTGPTTRTLTVDLGRLKGKVDAKWFNPANGDYLSVTGSPFPNCGSHDFKTPGNNGTGMNDWVLILTGAKVHQ